MTQMAFATYLLATIVIAAFSNVLLAQNLYIVEKDDLYGFVDKSGALVIPPKYGLAKAFREGLAPVYISGRWGYIDSEGNMKIEPQFWDADNFSNGIAAVHLKGGWGYVDRGGKLVIQPQFLQARRFSEGVAPVKSDKGWQFVDTHGIPIEGLSGFEDARSFFEGLATVRVGNRWRFITHKGNKQFDLEFVNVTNFGDQLAAVQEKENGKYGFIDHSGRYIINPTLDNAKPFTEGLAAVRLNKRLGVFEKER
jgi:WG containing repeat